MTDRTDREPSFTRRVFTIGGVVAFLLVLLYFLRSVAWVLLLLFAAILLAVFLRGLAMWLHRHTHLSVRVALGVVMISMLALAAAGGWLAGPRLADQIGQLSQRIPQAVDLLRSSLSQYEWAQTMLRQVTAPEQIFPLGIDVVGRITGFFSTALGVVANLLIVLVTGFYLAIQPRLYIDNLMHLLPFDQRDHMRDVFDALGRALRWWLVGRITSMFIVGALTTTALIIAGVPLAFTLGIIAALFSFVPYIGPIASVVPALLVALGESFALTGYVFLIYLVVQLLESNFITPLIQERVVSLPPALLIIAQVLFGVLAGLLGVLVAAPMTVTVIVFVQTLYVEDLLGDRVNVMGSSHARDPVSLRP